MNDKDRTIRIQLNKIEQYEKEKNEAQKNETTSSEAIVESVTCATQTERVSFMTCLQKLNQ